MLGLILTYSIVYGQMGIELNPVHGQCFSISKKATAMANALVDNVQANMLQAWCIALVFLLVRLGKELLVFGTYFLLQRTRGLKKEQSAHQEVKQLGPLLRTRQNSRITTTASPHQT